MSEIIKNWFLLAFSDNEDNVKLSKILIKCLKDDVSYKLCRKFLTLQKNVENSFKNVNSDDIAFNSLDITNWLVYDYAMIKFLNFKSEIKEMLDENN